MTPYTVNILKPLGVKDEMEADIVESEQRREEIMRESIHEDTLPQGEVSYLSEEQVEEAAPSVEEKVEIFLYTI